MIATCVHRIFGIATASYVAGLLLSQASFAQAKLAERSTGPTVGGFFDDMASWGSHHPGAAVALSATAVLAIGMAVYSRFSSKGK